MPSNIRHIELPEKDRPLREDVSLLGTLVGEMLVDQHGPGLLAAVERVRKASIRNREGDENAARDLEGALKDMDRVEVGRLIHAFATYLRAVNLAEKVHRIRRRRAYQRDQAQPQPGSLEAVLQELKEAGHSGEDIISGLSSLEIHPVFTAHPTEATRRTILEKEYDIVLRLVERLNPELTPAEERLALRRIRAAITSAWQTRLEPHSKTTVADELDNILFYITEILYRVTPAYYESIDEALARHFGNPETGTANRGILRFGSWVGGDMDGNPNVTADTFIETLTSQRRAIVRRYIPEVRRLARYLSQSISEIDFSESVTRRLEAYRASLPDIARLIPERDRDMPYRCLLHFVAARLDATLQDNIAGYESAPALAEDISLIRDSLAQNRGRHAGQFGVDRLLCRIHTFGFHLVALDLRQDAQLHRKVLGQLLGQKDWEERTPQQRAAEIARLLEHQQLPGSSTADPPSSEAAATLNVFRAMNRAQRQYGARAVGMFIISMARGSDDVLTVLALDALANPEVSEATVFEVTPLLETVDDLAAGPDILHEMLSNPVYRTRVRGLGNRQTVMIGYSDSSKDSGIVASRWALYEAQRKLIERGHEFNVGINFFHGRGGTVSRGGGNLVQGILGAPPGAVGGHLRMTEQGEVINQKYGVRFIALRNLELVTGATLTHSIDDRAGGLDHEERDMMTFMAEQSRRKFRGLVYGDPGFPAYFRATTPIDVIERLNIGSRPASRRSGEGIENLRAIPWVFSWAQTRIGFPGVFGFGMALCAAIDRYGIDRLRMLHAQRVFFQAMVNDVEMVLGKSELGLGRRYSELAGPGHSQYFEWITEEFDRAARCILELKQEKNLLDDQRVLQRNIRLRNPYVDPLHLLQIDLLRRWRDGGREDDQLLEALKATVKGIALGIQNTG